MNLRTTRSLWSANPTGIAFQNSKIGNVTNNTFDAKGSGKNLDSVGINRFDSPFGKVSPNTYLGIKRNIIN